MSNVKFTCAVVMSGLGGGYLPDNHHYICGPKTEVIKAISDSINWELDSCYDCWEDGSKEVIAPKSYDGLNRNIHFNYGDYGSYQLIESAEMGVSEFYDAIKDDSDYAELLDEWSEYFETES